MMNRLRLRTLFFFSFILLICNAQTVSVGSGSYTNIFPGTDEAGRNGYPSGSPQLSGAAVGKPVPTNDWWAKLLKENHVDNLFNYPYTLKTVTEGLVATYIPWGVIDDQLPVIVGVSGLNASRATVSNYTDWTVTMNWNDGSRNFEATSGIAIPFIYFTKGTNEVAQVKVNLGTVTISNEMLVIENARNGADFAIYAPTGSTWTKSGNVYTSTLNGKNYWSMAFIPLTASSVSAVANEYKKYAYVFPTNTTANYQYNEATSVMRTVFTVATETKEGTETQLLTGLLPHQWANLASDSPVPNKYSYKSVRGEIKTMAGNSFIVENKFYGILPTLPNVSNYSSGFNPSLLNQKISAIENDGLATWTDSYNEGQVMNRLIQTARIADLTNNKQAFDKLFATVKNRLENWLTYSANEKAFLFYYNSTWTAMLGYPSGHGQDTNINDHHFHWGYFIHAAAFIEQYQPGWASQFGGMVNLLVRDAASSDRNDNLFPYLRNFSSFAGHCWANGFATFPQGNDQESTSESMQFNSSLIHWGEVTNNKAIRDLGIYLYTTEQTAIEEYWFDMHERNFKSDQVYSLVSRVWGNSYDNGTFWTADIAASYGIELYPIHGGSLYLGHNEAYSTKLWDEITRNTGILSNQVNDNLWHDVMWQYAAFTNPAKAIELYNSYPNRTLKFGVSDAQTYHWLHAMNVLGKVDTTVTANHPLAAVFVKNNTKTYVAQNYSNQSITVHFSDGFELEVEARKLATNIDTNIQATLTSSFNQAAVGGSVNLQVQLTQGSATKVEFYDGDQLIGTSNTAPYTLKASFSSFGIHYLYAKIFNNANLNISNSVQVMVGNQLPYTEAIALPGTIEAGNYDKFEGGVGQNISYTDMNATNEGDYRKDEWVDAALHTTEGATVGWINSGEWLSYSVDVAQAGVYSMSFRYASGNAAGGGPFVLEMNDQTLTADITVPSTSTNSWNVWASKTVNDIHLTQGKHILKVRFKGGEFNLGKMTFTRTGDLPYSTPIANAGADLKVLLPQTTATLDASGSSETGSKALSYVWTQVYGPSVVQFVDAQAVQTGISNLEKGFYKFSLKVTNTDNRTATDELILLVTDTENVQPNVSITSPSNNSTFTQGKAIDITATASDFDGNIAAVDFYQNSIFIARANSAPYHISWTPSAGNYALTAIATDNLGATTESSAINIRVDQSMICSQTSTQAQQGSFTQGYIATFETVGTSVIATFELLDAKVGVVAYLWKQSPFGETQMAQIGNQKFTTTLGGLSAGTTINYACKFAFSGGMAVTRYFSYVVGSSCGATSLPGTENNSIKLYPNPVESTLFVNATTDATSLMSIYDATGRKVIEKQVAGNTSIDLSVLNKGIYYIKIENEQNSFSTKIIKK